MAGFGRSERLRERDRYVDRVQDRRLRGRKRRLTMTMRRSMIVCRLAQLAHQQKAKDGSDEPLPFMRSYQARKAAIEAFPDLKRLWKAQTTEALPPRRTYRAGRPDRGAVSAGLFPWARARQAALLAAMRLPASAAKGRFKKSLSMSGEVGSLAGDRVVSHERSRPADLPRRQDLRSRHAGPYPSHYCGCFSWCALLAHGHRCREAVTARSHAALPCNQLGERRSFTWCQVALCVPSSAAGQISSGLSAPNT